MKGKNSMAENELQQIDTFTLEKQIDKLAQALSKQMELFGPQIRASARLIAAALVIHPGLAENMHGTPESLAARAAAIVDALENELYP